MVGRALGLRLAERGHEILALVRSPEKVAGLLPYPAQVYGWSDSNWQAPEILNSIDAVINLAGEPVVGERWSEEYKKRLWTSRIDVTSRLAELFKNTQLKTFVSVSAIGFYGNRGDEELTEISQAGDDFLSGLCVAWERAADPLREKCRVVQPRLGIVLSNSGGFLREVEELYRLGVGGRLGSGRHWQSWIHIEDLCQQFLAVLENNSFEGPVNFVGPQPVLNQGMNEALAKALYAPLTLPTPVAALKLALGERAGVLMASQRVFPQKLVQQKFVFQFVDLTEALLDLYGALRKGERFFSQSQWVPLSREKIFGFFSDETNLEKLTPPWLNFHVLGKSTPHLQEGTRIDYKLRIKGVPVRWQSLISNWAPPQQFSDEQMVGPYRRWYHRHTFKTVGAGTCITDEISYALPLGWMGAIASQAMVRKDISKIFGYRQQVIKDLFG